MTKDMIEAIREEEDSKRENMERYYKLDNVGKEHIRARSEWYKVIMRLDQLGVESKFDERLRLAQRKA